MAVPRNTIDRRDINPKRQITAWADGVTIEYSKTVSNGHAAAGWGALTEIADGVYELADDDAQVDAYLILVEPDGAITIRTEGVCHFKAGTGATFTIGRGVIGALRSAARGYVKGVTVATQGEVNIETGKVHNDADADAIEVEIS